MIFNNKRERIENSKPKFPLLRGRGEGGVTLVETVVVLPILGILAVIGIEGADQIQDILAAQAQVAPCRGTEAQIGIGHDAKPGLVPTIDPTSPGYRFNTDPYYVINFSGVPTSAEITDNDMRASTVSLLEQVGVTDSILTQALGDAVVVHKDDGLEILRGEAYANLLCIAAEAETGDKIVFNGLGREMSDLMGDSYIPPSPRAEG
jgi:type II secretory pathway pseudopilin PulG